MENSCMIEGLHKPKINDLINFPNFMLIHCPFSNIFAFDEEPTFW